MPPQYPSAWQPPAGGWQPGQGGQWPQQQPQPWQPWYQPNPQVAAQAARNRKLGIGVAVACVVLIVGGAAAVAIGARLAPAPTPTASPRTITAASSIGPQTGSVIYTDDFKNPKSGWASRTLDSGTIFQYESGAYVVDTAGDLEYWSSAPFVHGRQALTVTAVATQTGGSVSDAFGVMCRQGTGAHAIQYEFLVNAGGDWDIERRDGPTSTSVAPSPIQSGSGAAPAGSTPLRVEAVCVSIDKLTTRLMLFVNGDQVLDTTDTDITLPSAGWAGGVMVSSGVSGQIVRFTSFEERDPTR